jgi:hypothetical protein
MGQKMKNRKQGFILLSKRSRDTGILNPPEQSGCSSTLPHPAPHVSKTPPQKEYQRKYYLTHLKAIKEKRKEWYLTNREKAIERQKKRQKGYYQTLIGKEANSKHHASQRKLGFKPLNKRFLGAEPHHIDKERVVYMPATIHQTIRHSLLRNRNMDAINKVAFEFLKSQEG